MAFGEGCFPFAVLPDAVDLLPDFAVVFELALGFEEELPDFEEVLDVEDVAGDLLFEEADF